MRQRSIFSRLHRHHHYHYHHHQCYQHQYQSHLVFLTSTLLPGVSLAIVIASSNRALPHLHRQDREDDDVLASGFQLILEVYLFCLYSLVICDEGGDSEAIVRQD